MQSTSAHRHCCNWNIIYWEREIISLIYASCSSLASPAQQRRGGRLKQPVTVKAFHTKLNKSNILTRFDIHNIPSKPWLGAVPTSAFIIRAGKHSEDITLTNLVCVLLWPQVLCCFRKGVADIQLAARAISQILTRWFQHMTGQEAHTQFLKKLRGKAVTLRPMMRIEKHWEALTILQLRGLAERKLLFGNSYFPHSCSG